MSNDSKTILVVDDDIDFLTQQRIQLEAMGYNVVSAESMREATEMLDTVQPDMAILDLMMEQNDAGFALCYQIKKKYPDTPVVLITAVTSETGIEFDAETREERNWVKADQVLAKPVRYEQLQDVVRRHLED